MTGLRIYLYTWGVLNRIMADLKGYADFDEFVKAVSQRMKLYPQTFNAFSDCKQYVIVSHKGTTFRGSRILAFAKWNSKENKLEITKV